MHLCARDRLKERLYTACKELILKLFTVCDNNLICHRKERYPRSVIIKLMCHINKRHPRNIIERNLYVINKRHPRMC